MNYNDDKRIVMTLDAGGTNFVFSAMQSNKEVLAPITLPSNGSNLEKCLDTIIEGFSKVKEQLSQTPVAISFAFPGPADYPHGIIGDLGNLPAFKGGIALGPMLEEIFGIPVFINNDGDLYAYGEAIGGYLPYVNRQMEKAGNPKRFNNLIGFTLGTGFGGGIVRNGELFIGDNSAAGEVWLLRNKTNPQMNAEEGVSIRAIKRTYAALAGIAFADAPEPKDIYDIVNGTQPGNKAAAREAFRQMAIVLGNAIADVATVLDGILVIGGGLAGASSVFLPMVIEEMRGVYTNFNGGVYPRLAQKVFNLEDTQDLAVFVKGMSQEVVVPRSTRKVAYDPMSRIGVGITQLGASKAISIGAYAFALSKLTD